MTLHDDQMQSEAICEICQTASGVVDTNGKEKRKIRKFILS